MAPGAMPAAISASGGLRIVIVADDGSTDGKLAKLAGKTLFAIPNFQDPKIGKWRLDGILADELALSN
jgi:hypothetical protein